MGELLNADDMRALEAMIDRATLAVVLDSLAEIASGKAEHIRTNWQDGATAKSWDRAARRLDGVASQIGV